MISKTRSWLKPEGSSKRIVEAGHSMSLGEEIRDYQREIGWNERDVLAKQEMIEMASNHVVNNSRSFGVSVEKSADALKIDDKIRDQVLAEARRKLGQDNRTILRTYSNRSVQSHPRPLSGSPLLDAVQYSADDESHCHGCHYSARYQYQNHYRRIHVSHLGEDMLDNIGKGCGTAFRPYRLFAQASA